MLPLFSLCIQKHDGPRFRQFYFCTQTQGSLEGCTLGRRKHEQDVCNYLRILHLRFSALSDQMSHLFYTCILLETIDCYSLWQLQSNNGGNSIKLYEWIHSSHNGHGFLNYPKSTLHNTQQYLESSFFSQEFLCLTQELEALSNGLILENLIYIEREVLVFFLLQFYLFINAESSWKKPRGELINRFSPVANISSCSFPCLVLLAECQCSNSCSCPVFPVGDKLYCSN